MPDDNTCFLAIRKPDEPVELWQEGHEVLFRFVDFWQSSALEFRLSPAHKWPSFQLPYCSPKKEQKQYSQKEYQTIVSKARAFCRQADRKIVTSRTKWHALVLDPEEAFKSLCRSYPQATVYFFIHPQAGAWLGATPEILLTRAGHSLETISLAGTRRPDQKEDFTDKEKEEQHLVTQFIAQTFADNPGIDSVEQSPVRVIDTGHLKHLQTQFKAQSNAAFREQDLLKDLHPTPAVAGYPRQESLAYLRKEESYQRRYYSGYFGLSSSTKSAYWVNLRCAELFNTGIYLYAGGGITAQSDPQDEWFETEAKMDTLLNVLSRN
jgi:isochorismate synthase